MNVSRLRSALVLRPASLAPHRVPAPLSREALQRWLSGLGASGATLSWEAQGFRLSWSDTHHPALEASHLDRVRGNFEALAALFHASLPSPIEEGGSPAEDAACYHAWRVTAQLQEATESLDDASPQQSGLFAEVDALERLPLCFGDCETTGFSPETNRICQLALVRVEPSGETRSYLSDFNPEQPNGAASFNKISDHRLRSAPYLRNEVSRFLPLLQGAIFVAHNAGFDQRFLTKELSRQSIAWPALHTIDTMPLSKAVWPKAPKHKLEVLAPWLNIHQGRVHDAMGDTETLIALWGAMRAACPELKLSKWVKAKK